mgnify:CR=1 FL=1
MAPVSPLDLAQSRVLVLTGAGVSAESGLATFRENSSHLVSNAYLFNLARHHGRETPSGARARPFAVRESAAAAPFGHGGEDP